MARPPLGEGHAGNRGAGAQLLRFGGLPRPGCRVVHRRSVRRGGRGARSCGSRRGARAGAARSGAPPRPVGGDGPPRPGWPGGGHCEGHHRRPPTASGPARDSRSVAGGEVHLRRHGHGARQVAVLPNLRRLPRADRPCREPVHLPLAGAHRRPGVPSADEPRALRYRERRHYRRIDARGARGGVRGAGRREPRYRAHHAGVPHVPHRRAGGLGARRVRRRGRGAPHRTGQGRPARGLHPARPGADPARRPRGARGDRHG